MQLLFKNGFEDGETEGLNLIGGSVTKMEVDQNLKLPHVGWNSLIFKEEQNCLTKLTKILITILFTHTHVIQ